MRVLLSILLVALVLGFGSSEARQKPDGEVKVEITVDADGKVADSKIVSEKPKGQGFGDAALKAIKKYEFEGSKPGTYTITIRFNEEGSPAP